MSKEHPMIEASRKFHEALDELVAAHRAPLVALLREWLAVPYLETREAYDKFISDFRPRVEAAIERHR